MLAKLSTAACSCALACCVAAPSEHPTQVLAPATVQPDTSAYVQVADAEALAELVERDLARRDFAAAYEGLQEFTESCVLAGHETRGHLFMKKLRPVWRFQTSGGHPYIDALKQLEIMLARGAGAELGRAYSAVERGDLDSLRRLRADARSVFGDEVRPLSSENAPHAAFVDGLLRFDELRHADDKRPAEARTIAADLTACSQTLERAGYGEMSFVARIAAAQALDVAGLEAEALDKWIAVGQSRQLRDADESVQVAIAGRIQSYRDRLRAEMERRIRAEEESKVRESVQALESRYAHLSDEQRARIASLEAEIQRLIQAKDDEVRAGLATQRQLFEGTLDQQSQRIRDLEELFVEIAVAEKRDWRGMDEALLAQGRDVLGVVADVLSIWQATRFRAQRDSGADG